MLQDMSTIEPVKRTLDSKFRFQCHKDLSCFTGCCGRTSIILTPYDIVRIKNRLGITSGDFLDKYTFTYVDEVTSHPYVVLKTMDNNDGKCLFVTSEGCSVYEDRPSNCRYYPVGQGIMVVDSENGPVNDSFYFFVEDPNCLGCQEGSEWTIESWRIDQGIDLYDEMNKEWMEIQLRRDPSEQSKLDSKKQTMLYMASYDIDKFRKFVFESKLLDIFKIDEKEIEKIKNDEISLMQFGFRYLKYILMLEETLEVKEEYKKEKHSNKAEGTESSD